MKLAMKILSCLALSSFFTAVDLKAQTTPLNFTPTEATVYIRASFDDKQRFWHDLQETILADIKNDYATRPYVELDHLTNYFAYVFAYYAKPTVVNGRYTITQLNDYFTLVEACTVYIGSTREGLYIEPCKALIAFSSLYNNDPNALSTSIFNVEYNLSKSEPTQVVDLAKKRVIFNNLVKNMYITDDQNLLEKHLSFKPTFTWTSKDVTDSSLRQSVFVWKSFFNVNIIKEAPNNSKPSKKSNSKNDKSAT
ncbi:hypothetical protein CJP74_06465 [Psittacicella melopsittaci]|uniref:Uncharacterized protein n=1 Tax=Psittacicella melopsittaci TaxID=2028576 RepID=A0A3A1Y6S0_9GAMM|nr:hypothetical protein [Psittacicella melopsittaci]RIY31754.1 hypothetical protein CJP74_06465 [Psittacicella melopsittaci]